MLSYSWDTKIKPFGVPTKMHWSVLMLLGLCMYQLGWFGIPAFLLIIASVMVHEYAHVYVSLKMGVSVKSVIFMALGAAALLDVQPGVYNYKEELWISAAGPIASLALSLLGLPFLFLFPHNMVVVYFVALNVLLTVFNMLPLYPLDGGRVVHSLIAKKFGLRKAINISVWLSTILSAVLLGFSIWFVDFWMCVIFVMIIIMAWVDKMQTEDRMGWS